MKAEFVEQILRLKVDHPWGHSFDFIRTPQYVLKYLCIKVGEETSLQYHQYRHETWLIMEGKGLFSGQVLHQNLLPGDVIHIPKGLTHKLTNVGDTPLVVTEFQAGVCDESDIVRVSDKYRRTP